MKGKEGKTRARIDKRQVMSGARRQEAGDRKGEEKTTGTRWNGQSKDNRSRYLRQMTGKGGGDWSSYRQETGLCPEPGDMRQVTGKWKRRRQEQEGTDKVKDKWSRYKRQMKGKEGETGARIDKRRDYVRSQET